MTREILKSWQEQAEDILSSQPQERQVYDAERVDKIVSTLKSLPAGKLIMDWAENNGISIWLDYQCKDSAGGYHIIGSKTVCLSAHMSDLDLMPILAHELRHAWQDSQSLMPSIFRDVDTYLKQLRFIEADATAHEFQIFTEMQEIVNDIRSSSFYKLCDDILKQTKKTGPEFLKGKEALWSGFCGFFADRSKRCSYDSGAIVVGEIIAGMKSTEEVRLQTEYSPDKYSMSAIEGIDIYDDSSIRKIADMFNGGNYLADIKVDFSKNEQFVRNISNFNMQRIEKLKKQVDNKHTNVVRIPTII